MMATPRNVPAPNVPFFTPAQVPASGTAVVPQPDDKPIPTLFQPIRIRGIELQNRIVLAPLCQYSGKDGLPGPWHVAHLGGIISRGPGLSFVEATAVTPEGRITPDDLGIWSDEHISAYKELTTFAHSQNQKIAIQLAHAGRKASTVAPWLHSAALATEEVGGWPNDVVGPSPVAHSEPHATPKELTREEIKSIVNAFADGARRSIKAEFDVLEIHAAHGYLLHEFLSPVSNFRTDDYGGSFENRIRIVVEVTDAIRAVMPANMPLFIRVSATDQLEESLPDTPSWRVSDTIKLAAVLAQHGVDLIDVSSAGNHPAQKVSPLPIGEATQAHLSAEIRAAVGDKILVGAVGGIRNGKVAQLVLDRGQADIIFVGRYFQQHPGAVWQFADDLGVQIKAAHQIEWGFFGRGGRRIGKRHAKL